MGAHTFAGSLSPAGAKESLQSGRNPWPAYILKAKARDRKEGIWPKA
jgi:hypothetical protein